MVFIQLRLFVFLSFVTACNLPEQESANNTANNSSEVRGWNILSRNEPNALRVIEAASNYDINHLQLSHQIMMDLRHVRDTARQGLARRLTRKAHKEGIEEVVVWDHALYNLNCYPDEFKTGPDSTINLDNPEFWEWFREDYRDMLDRVPEIDGIVLTFIETGAHVEDQYSEQMPTEQEKLARLVDEVASVIMDEYEKVLYIRTFIYTQEELDAILKCLNLIEHNGITVMMKEVPHDFFLTHSVNKHIKEINRPVIIEFDGGHEYNGQGIVMNSFVDTALERWKYYLQQPNVVGYVARTDRYGETTAIGRPHEVNLLAYHRAQQDSSITADSVCREFITDRYGDVNVEQLMPVFQNGYDMITSSFYSLRLNTVNHSRLDFDRQSTYARHVSGRWLEDKTFKLDHDVNRQFHYWKDVVNHLAPVSAKTGQQMRNECAHVLANDWVLPKELITLDYVKYVAAEKDYSVSLTEKMLNSVKGADLYKVNMLAHQDLLQTMERTLLTAQLRRAAAKAYYGYRLYARGEDFRSNELNNLIQEGLDEIEEVTSLIENYEPDVPNGGQWRWQDDVEKAREYHRLITESGWDKFGGVVFSSTDS
jgi:hypothetical protein